jgi:hypothetical protein
MDPRDGANRPGTLTQTDLLRGPAMATAKYTDRTRSTVGA